MIILENQDELSPLKTEGEMDITTPFASLLLSTAPPPPYVPTLSPNYQAVPLPHHVTPRRQFLIRRLHVTFAIACLVLLLCGAIIYGFHETAISSQR
jgi:hypothetical protein